MAKSRPQRRIDRNVAQVARNITVTGGGTGGGLTSHTHAGYATDEDVLAVVTSAIATHGANPNAHHNRLHDILGVDDHEITAAAYTLIGATLTDTLGKLYIASSGDGIDVTKSGGTFTVDVDVSDFVGDGLRDDGSNNVAIKPSDFAGNGLTSSSYDLHVGAGDGITVGTNDVAVDESYDFAWTGDHTHTGSIASNPFDSADPITGWKIEADGDAWFANIEATSLTIKTFVADVTLALAGSDIITKSRAIVSRDFTTPSVSGTLYVHDLPGQPNTAVFESGDFVRLRYVQRSTGLVVGDVWGTVSSYSDLADTEQSWTFTRTSGTVGQTIYAGMVAIDYGTSGDGVIELTSLGSDTPYISLRTWTTTPANSGNFTTVARLGNLSGITDADYGSLSGYGLYTDDIKARGSIGAAGGDVWIGDEGINIQSATGASMDWSDYGNKITFSTAPLEAQSAPYVVSQIGTRRYDTGSAVWNILEVDTRAGTAYTVDEAVISIEASFLTGTSSAISLSATEEYSTASISANNLLDLNAATVRVYGNISMGYEDSIIGTAEVPVGTIYVDTLVAGTSSTIDTGHTHVEFPTRAEIYALLAGYSTTDHSHASLVTSATLTSTLASYATTAALTAAIADFLDSDDLDTALADYVTSTSLTGTLSTYATQSYVISQLTNYVESSTLTSTLAGYVTSSSLTTTLGDYVTSSSLTTTLGSYVTSSGLTATLGGFYSKAQTDALLGGYSLTTHSHTSLPLTEITYGGSATINIGTDGTLSSANYVSGRAGYSLGPTGLEANNADIRGVIRSGMLQAQGTLYSYGTQLFAPSAKLRDAMTVTAHGTQITVAVDDGDAGHVQVFAVGEILNVKGPAYIEAVQNDEDSIMDVWTVLQTPAAVELSSDMVASVWLEVDSVSDETTHWEYTCTVRYGPRSIFSPGAIVGSYGTSTTGRISITSDALYAPYLDVFTAGATPWAGVTPHLRIGMLDGLAVGAADRDPGEYGQASAADLRDATGAWLITSNQRVASNNITATWTDGDSRLQITADEGIRFATRPLLWEGSEVIDRRARLEWIDPDDEDDLFMRIGPGEADETGAIYGSGGLPAPLSLVATHRRTIMSETSSNEYYNATVYLAARPSAASPGTREAYIRIDSRYAYEADVPDIEGGGDTDLVYNDAYIEMWAPDGLNIYGPTRINQSLQMPAVVYATDLPTSTLDLGVGRLYIDPTDGAIKVMM